MMKVTDYLVARIAQLGVRHVFMLAGGPAMHIMDSLGRNGQNAGPRYDLPCRGRRGRPGRRAGAIRDGQQGVDHPVDVKQAVADTRIQRISEQVVHAIHIHLTRDEFRQT